MTIGIIMMVHGNFNRVAQTARHWATQSCPVVIHVDKRIDQVQIDGLSGALSDFENIRFARRYQCDWGQWSIVEATQAASEMMLDSFPDVTHVLLTSGSCLPLRPVKELSAYLEKWPRTDFIESATTEDVPWTVGGLDRERFTLRFPFSWKKHRRLFDRYVAIQRRIGFRRKIPKSIVPHMGSQWWCLTRQTLSAILQDPDRPIHDRYFNRVWIPDESYFQTLARRYATNIESRSLTLSKFDFQGRPHIFYDDHLDLLRRSNCFVARKIWRDANKLYDTFLNADSKAEKSHEPDPGKIDRIFAKAIDRRTRGRPGLYMSARFPNKYWDHELTSSSFSVFEGFSNLFQNFEGWLAKASGANVHGHLFAPDRVEFSRDQEFYFGALPNSAALRDYNPRAFLTNIIWNSRSERQCFQFGPRDNQAIASDLAMDPNAQISVVSGAWAVPLFHSNNDFADIRHEAARLQQIENNHLEMLRAPGCKARVRIWSLAEFVAAPMEPLQIVIDEIGPRGRIQLTEAPKMAELKGFGQFLQNLKNQGMHPYLMGDFPSGDDPHKSPKRRRKPYIVG